MISCMFLRFVVFNSHLPLRVDGVLGLRLGVVRPRGGGLHLAAGPLGLVVDASVLREVIWIVSRGRLLKELPLLLESFEGPPA